MLNVALSRSRVAFSRTSRTFTFKLCTFFHILWNVTMSHLFNMLIRREMRNFLNFEYNLAYYKFITQLSTLVWVWRARKWQIFHVQKTFNLKLVVFLRVANRANEATERCKKKCNERKSFLVSKIPSIAHSTFRWCLSRRWKKKVKRKSNERKKIEIVFCLLYVAADSKSLTTTEKKKEDCKSFFFFENVKATNRRWKSGSSRSKVNNWIWPNVKWKFQSLNFLESSAN